MSSKKEVVKILWYSEKTVETFLKFLYTDLIDDDDCDQMSRGDTGKGGSDWKSYKHVINFDEPKPKETVKRSVLLVFESNH